MGKKEVITTVVVGVASAAVGFTAGYLVSKKRFEMQLAELNDDLDDVVQSFDQVRSAVEGGKFVTPQDAVEALIPSDDGRVSIGREALDQLLEEHGLAPLNGNEVEFTPESEEENEIEDTSSGVLILENPGGDNFLELPEKEEPEDEYPNGMLDETAPITGETIVQSIWENGNNQVPINIVMSDEPEMPDSDPDHPYIITVDQYMDNEIHEDNKISVMYYEEDDVLVDEREQRVPDIEGTVGSSNLHKFGLGSKDPNVLYVRNEKLNADFEIILDRRSYQEVVLGIKPPRESVPPRKMRNDDE
jgi:hypothetical protein